MKRVSHTLRYINHFLTANSRHGTHSPFVYTLADKVIYNHGNARNKKEKGVSQLIGEIADYFEVAYTSLHADEGQHRALEVELESVTVDELVKLQHRFRYIVVYGIQDEYKNLKQWKALQDDARFVVTIDLFFFGLIFYRTQQPKQHFKLRFPFWKYM